MSLRTPVAPTYRTRRQRAIAATRAALPATDVMLTNLRAIADEADADDYPGLFWYHVTHGALKRLATDHGTDLRTTVGVFAALSPGVTVEQNHRLAESLLFSGDASHPYGGDPTDKARAILDGADPTTVLGGPKVRSFYRNLMYPHRHGPVTIDRHAVAILFGRPLSDSERGRALDRVGAYSYLAGIYRAVAREHDMSPHALQATTWNVWRDNHAYGKTTNIEEF